MQRFGPNPIIVREMEKFYNASLQDIESDRKRALQRYSLQLKELAEACGNDLDSFRIAKEEAEKYLSIELGYLNDLEATVRNAAADVIDAFSSEPAPA